MLARNRCWKISAFEKNEFPIIMSRMILQFSRFSLFTWNVEFQCWRHCILCMYTLYINADELINVVFDVETYYSAGVGTWVFDMLIVLA